MKVIYKYRLPFQEVAKVTMPKDATIIRIDGLDGALWIWAIVDTNQDLEVRTFNLYKTGGVMPDNINEAAYFGCGAIFVQMELMMYVFEFPGLRYPAAPPPPPFDWIAASEA